VNVGSTHGVALLTKGLMSCRFQIGKFLGIDLFVHWTFLLLVAYVFFSSIGEGFNVALFMLAQLLGVFFCVTLHEYGHAMAARRFGIGTADITLLPIGGVARLHRMPRIPWQEMIVAIAGPAVNVVLVVVLAVVFATQVSEEMLIGLQDLAAGPQEGLEMSQDVATAIDTMFRFPSIAGFLFTMIAVNIMLVLFNLIPAFPMDGGRVLRSFVAMFTNYTMATKIAFRIGFFCAALMIFFSIQGQSSNPVPIFIGLFVAFAGYSEFKQVEITEAVRGRVVAEAMICTKTMVSEDLSLKDLAKKWKGTSDRMLPVVNAGGHPIGMVQMSKLISSLSQPDSDTKLVSSLIDRNQPLKLVKDSELLEQALPKLDRRIRQHLVVDDQGVVTGVIDLDTMVQRLCLHDQESNDHATAEVRHFDQIN